MFEAFILFIAMQLVVLLGLQPAFPLQSEAILMYQQDVQWHLLSLGKTYILYQYALPELYAHEFMLKIYYFVLILKKLGN